MNRFIETGVESNLIILRPDSELQDTFQIMNFNISIHQLFEVSR